MGETEGVYIYTALYGFSQNKKINKTHLKYGGECYQFFYISLQRYLQNPIQHAVQTYASKK
jgi:hypothetical protein